MTEEKIWREVRPAPPQPINWHRVAESLRRSANEAFDRRNAGIFLALAAAIEDGLS